MGKTKQCECCGKIFICKSILAKYCSLNCRVKANYHKNHPDAKTYVKGRTKEERRKLATDYFRNRYREDKEFRDLIKTRRMIYYYKNANYKK